MPDMLLQDAIALANQAEAAGDTARAIGIVRSLYEQIPTPDMASLYATTLCRVGERDQNLTRIMKRHPDNRLIRAAVSEMALQDGDYETGFRLCGNRWAATKSASIMPQIPCPTWDGKPFDGDLIVVGEQGLGEEILYLSALDKLANRAIVSADQRLHALIARSFPQHVVAHKSTVRHFATPAHRKIEAMELTGILGHRSNSQRWLLPHAQQSANMRAALTAALPDKPIVGISWASARERVGDAKTIPKEAMLPLLTDSRLACVNLQYGSIQADASYWQANGGTLNEIEGLDLTGDIDGLASLIAACDVVVTCSNTTAHLAGALGKRTILIAPGSRFVLWFWGQSERTPWYPTIEIIRAKTGWPDAVAKAISMI